MEYLFAEQLETLLNVSYHTLLSYVQSPAIAHLLLMMPLSLTLSSCAHLKEKILLS